MKEDKEGKRMRASFITINHTTGTKGMSEESEWKKRMKNEAKWTRISFIPFFHLFHFFVLSFSLLPFI